MIGQIPTVIDQTELAASVRTTQSVPGRISVAGMRDRAQYRIIDAHPPLPLANLYAMIGRAPRRPESRRNLAITVSARPGPQRI